MCRDFNSKNNKNSCSMTPLKDREKSIPSRKRQRQQQQRQQQQPSSVKSSHFVGEEDAALFNLFLLPDDDEADLLRDEEAQLTLEVASLKHAVGRMQSQVAAASAQLKELKALVAALMHHRAARKQQELKKRRVDA